tara:strand:- start:276 stop:554 length:279 start_codon:yes stop_codon:yes gene_type:complete
MNKTFANWKDISNEDSDYNEYNKLESYAYESNEKLLILEKNIAELRLGLLKIRSQLEINQKEYKKKRVDKTALYWDMINDVKSIVLNTLKKT